jgi:LPXTG-motif cell wall-anchored protein
VIALIILLATLFTRGPQQASQTSEQVKTIVAYNTKVAGTATADAVKALQAQATVDAAAKAPPPTATPPQAATPTGVLAIPTATRTPIPTVSPENATKTAFALTLGVGGAVGTSYPGQGTPQPTATALPSTGFADEVGLPGLLGMAAIMLVVIFLARRVRLVTH